MNKLFLKRLRILRHPNVLKFLSSYASEETVYLLTELVSPVDIVLKTLRHDEAIKGLRDIARGLQFLHEKVRCKFLSHTCTTHTIRLNSQFFFNCCNLCANYLDAYMLVIIICLHNRRCCHTITYILVLSLYVRQRVAGRLEALSVPWSSNG